MNLVLSSPALIIGSSCNNLAVCSPPTRKIADSEQLPIAETKTDQQSQAFPDPLFVSRKHDVFHHIAKPAHLGFHLSPLFNRTSVYCSNPGGSAGS